MFLLVGPGQRSRQGPRLGVRSVVRLLVVEVGRGVELMAAPGAGEVGCGEFREVASS